MKNYKLLLILILLCTKAFSQENLLEEYYIVDSIILKNRVKQQMDTLSAPPKQNEIIEFDTLGRRVLSYHINSDFKYKYEYKNYGDTVLCFLSIVSDKNPGGRLIEIQKYLYNLQGKVVLYSDCYENTNHISAQLTKFYYDSSNKMTAKHFYYAHNFSKKLDAYYTTDVAAYELNSAENYFYDNKDRMVSVKQMTGPKDERFTETLQYDERGRVKTIARFQKYGAMGELRLMNIHQRTKYVYTDSSWIKYKFIFSGDKVGKNEAGQYHPTTEKVFTPGGLISKEYLGGGKDKTLYKKYEYVYF
ncbi:MAG: hypothetical protein J7599_21405 [Niabella sp.]|nr:hypothetical protein [Niabella sp.]